MLQLRPTFSESWYRVINLKPRMRGTAQISRQYYRGERWYVVRDAASNQFHRLNDSAYRFVGLLDGSRTVGEAWDLVGGQLADDAPTQPEVIQILSQLYAANLVETDIPPDATILLRRHKKQMQRKFQGRLMNVLFPRIPIWDCDRFLVRWLPLAKVAFSRLGAVIWLATIITALILLGPHWTDLRTAASSAIDLRNNPENAFWLWAVFCGIKFIHECGHAFSCRRFGGEVHEMGIMFLVFVPTPYVDASTAWAFPSRWHRMFVGMAGMIVELFVAALCGFFWIATKDSNTLATHLAYNAMLIASVSTLVFNANPLLRYDGYYILSDFLEIPNLQMRSREYILGLIKRHIFRIKLQQPLPPVGQRVLLFVYGVLSTAYRVFVGLLIILMVTWQIPILGVLMGIGGVITWAVVPIVRLFRYLTIEPELHRKRGRAWAFCLATGALAAVIIGVIPFPISVYANGIVEPQLKDVMHSTTPGWVKQIIATDGAHLKKGDVILIADSPDLNVQIAEYNSKISELEVAMRQSSEQNPAKLAIDRYQLEAVKEQLSEATRQKNELTFRAPFDGQLIAPELRDLQDRYLSRGTEVCTVATMDRLMVRAAIDQTEAQLAYDEGRDPTAEIRLASMLDKQRELHTTDFRIIDAAQRNLPHPSLGQSGGGDVQVDPSDKSGTKTMIPIVELQAIVANPQEIYESGQAAYVRLKLAKRPLIWQWGRKFLQLVQERSNSKWL